MANITELQQIMIQAAEQQQRLARSLSVATDLSRLGQLAHLPPAGLAQSVAAVAREHQALLATFRVAANFEDVAQRIKLAQAAHADITAPFRKIAEEAQRQAAMWTTRIGPAFDAISSARLALPQLSSTALAWEWGVAGVLKRLQETGVLAAREALAAHLLNPSRVYTDFVAATTDRLAAATEFAQKALRGSLFLAETQLAEITDTICDMVVLPEDDDASVPPRPLTSPFLQQEELLASGEIGDEHDLVILVRRAPAAQSSRLSREMLRLVAQCNEASKTEGQPEIFKPTTRLLEVCADLPWLVASDRTSFADVVDCLYFVFYEGAGKDNLRFLKKQGGPLEDTECDLIWCIKHLRNKWTRHDADHGKDSDIRRSWLALVEKFRWLQLGFYPTESAHFRALHDRLLRESVSFLRQILRKLTHKEEQS